MTKAERHRGGFGRSLRLFVIITFVVVAGLIAFVNGRDLSWAIGDRVEQRLSEQAGRPISVNGRVGVRLGWGVVHAFAEDVTSESGEASTTGFDVRAESASLALGLWALLKGDVDLRGIALREAHLVLPASAPHPDASDEVQTGRAEQILSMLERTRTVSIDNLHIIRERTNREPHQIDIDQMTLSPEGAGLVALFVGVVDGTPYDMAAHLNSLGNYMRGEGSSATLTASIGRNELTADGTVTQAWPLAAEGTFEGHAEDIARLGQLVGIRLDGAGAGRMAGAVRLDGQRATMSFSALEIAPREGGPDAPPLLGPTQGDVIVTRQEGGHFRVEGTLSPARLELDTLRGTGNAAARVEVTGESRPLPFAHVRIPYSAMNRIDMGLDLVVGEFQYRDLLLHDVDLPLRGSDGVFTIEDARAHYGQGEVRLHLEADAGSESVELNASGLNVQIGELLANLGNDAVIHGTTDFAIQGRGRGGSVGEVLGSFSGQTNMMIGGGRLMRGGIDFLAADLLQTFFAERDQHSTELQCLVSRLDFEGGVGHSQALLVDTALITITGSGHINLTQNEMSFRLAPRPKDPTLLSLAADYHVTGPVQDPRFAPDPGGLLRGVATTLGSFALTGGTAALLPLIAHGDDEENPCVAALSGRGSHE